MKKPHRLTLEKQGTNSWSFAPPPQWEFLGHKLERAKDAEHTGNKEEATRIYLELIKACPEYLPALNNLGLLLRTQGDIDGAITTLEKAVKIGLACLPEEFEVGIDLIPWHWEDNRPFLLAYENLASCYLLLSHNAFTNLLELSPGHRGIAGLVARLDDVHSVEDESVG